jgi:FkbM family methyltransferase
VPISPPTIQVDTVVGPLLAHRDDEVITSNLVRWGIWEAPETHFLRAALKAGGTFVDVGANIGYFSVLAAHSTGIHGTVIAIEPEPRNAAVLRANLERIQCSNAIVLEIAAYSQPGWMSLALNESNRGDHYLVAPNDDDMLVRCERLDDVLQGPVDLVKIDTQGFDHDVLAGLTRTIGANPELIVLTELSLRSLDSRSLDARPVLAGYAELGFSLSLLDGWGRPRASTIDGVLGFCAGAGLDEVTLVLCQRRGADASPA